MKKQYNIAVAGTGYVQYNIAVAGTGYVSLSIAALLSQCDCF